MHLSRTGWLLSSIIKSIYRMKKKIYVNDKHINSNVTRELTVIDIPDV